MGMRWVLGGAVHTARGVLISPTPTPISITPPNILPSSARQSTAQLTAQSTAQLTAQ